jgi:hypothetical protein
MSLIEHDFFAPEEANEFLTLENLIAPTAGCRSTRAAATSPSATCTGSSCRSRPCASCAALDQPGAGRASGDGHLGPDGHAVSSMLLGTEDAL